MNGGWFIKIGQDLGRTTTESTILWGQQQQGVITKPWPKGDLGSGKPKFRKKRYIRAFHRNSGLGRKRQPINMTSQGMSKGNKYPWFHTLLPWLPADASFSRPQPRNQKNRDFGDTVYTAQPLQSLLCNLCNTCYCRSLRLCDSSGYVVSHWTFNMHLFIYLWPHRYPLLGHFSISYLPFSSLIYTSLWILYMDTLSNECIEDICPLCMTEKERESERNRYLTVLPIYQRDYLPLLSIQLSPLICEKCSKIPMDTWNLVDSTENYICYVFFQYIHNQW